MTSHNVDISLVFHLDVSTNDFARIVKNKEACRRRHTGTFPCVGVCVSQGPLWLDGYADKCHICENVCEHSSRAESSGFSLGTLGNTPGNGKTGQ